MRTLAGSAAVVLSCVAGAGTVLENVRAHNRMWLAPDPGVFAGLSFERIRAGKSKRIRLDTAPEFPYHCGASFACGLEQAVADPGACEEKVRFEGRLGDRDVVLLELTGSFRLYYAGGNTSANRLSVVVERETGLPLVILSPNTQVFLLDYTEVEPGQHVPLRVAWIYENRRRGWRRWKDIRFQLVNGRVWLLEKATGEDGKLRQAIGDVRVNGRPTTSVHRCESPVPRVADIEWFDMSRVTDRRNLCFEDGIVEAIRERNQPWLAPSFDHLENVSFVHEMEPGVFNERFCWRRDGTSVVEVVADPSEKNPMLGQRWVTTPEPAFYTIAAEGRFATPSDKDRSFFRRHVRGRLMGTRAMFLALDWGLEPDRFTVQSVKETKPGGLYVMSLVPKERRYYLHAGAMFHHRSYAYVHHIKAARGEIAIDAETLHILSETAYARDGSKVCEIEFADYRPVDEQQAVPGSIRLFFPEQDFRVIYHFEWRPEGLWILTHGESRFEKSGGHERQTITSLTVNGATDELDEALALVRKTDQYLASGREPERLQLPSHRFVFGKSIALQHGKLLFTETPEHHLVARLRAPAEALGQRLAIALFDAEGRLLAAARGGDAEGSRWGQAKLQLDFGGRIALRRVAWFAAWGLEPEAEPEARQVQAYPFVIDRQTALHVAEQREKKTAVKRLTWRGGDGGPHASLELMSQNHWRGFDTDATVALLDEQLRLIEAQTDTIRWRVSRDIVVQEHEMAFDDATAASAKWVLLGLNRGRTRTVRDGSRWAIIARLGHAQSLFPEKDLLESDDPSAVFAGLKTLEAEMRGNHYIEDELFDDRRDHQRAIERGRTRADLLKPRARDLARHLKMEDTTVASLACRLLGHSGERRYADRMVPLLEDRRDEVRDAAAIGLGLLGDARGLSRLAAILERRTAFPSPGQNWTPETRQAYRSLQAWQDDAAAALMTIGTDEAVEHLGGALLRALGDITVTPAEGGGFGVSGAQPAENLVRLLGHTHRPKALEWLRKALDLEGDADQVDREILETMRWFKDGARPHYVAGLRKADAAVVRAVSKTADPHYLPHVKAVCGHSELSDRALYYAIRYFWNLKSPEGLAALREVHTRELRTESTRAWLTLARALADHGDSRGLDYAFETVRRLQESVEPPEDEKERKSLLRQRERMRGKAADVFEDGRKVRETALVMLEGELTGPDPLSIRAALTILKGMGKLSEEMRQTVERLTHHQDTGISEAAQKLIRRR